MRIALPVLVLLAMVGAPGGESPDPDQAGGSILGLVIFGTIAIGFSFFCSIAEAVILSVTPSFIATLAEKGKRAAVLLEGLKANIDRPLAAILTLNTVAHTVGAAGVGAQAAGIWGSEAVGWASGFMTLMILVLSEIIPKTLGAIHWRRLAPVMARALDLLIKVFYPFVRLSELITRMLGGKRQEVVTREEVAAMAEISLESGEIGHRESQILNNLFRLQSLTAHDIMTPRPVLIAFPEEMTVEQVLSESRTIPVSRIPVYKESIDHVTGFVLKNDILLARANEQAETPLTALRREVRSVSETAPLMLLLDVLLRERNHLAIVVDEYGGVDGLVTMEDLIETLLGIEIVDEADEAIDMQRYARRQWKRRAEAAGLDLHGMEENLTSAGQTHPEQGKSRDSEEKD